jgi:hypothetical protein
MFLVWCYVEEYLITCGLDKCNCESRDSCGNGTNKNVSVIKKRPFVYGARDVKRC